MRKTLVLFAVLLVTFLPAMAQTTTHTVTLNWVAPASGGQVTGYNVYRGTATGGPYTILGTATTPTYVDSSNLTEGIKYFYVVTATGPGGESPDSNEASALIPFSKPSPPTSLAATPK